MPDPLIRSRLQAEVVKLSQASSDFRIDIFEILRPENFIIRTEEREVL